MSKVKQYYMNEAEKSADLIIDDYVKSKIDFTTAKFKLKNVENVNLIDIDENNVKIKTLPTWQQREKELPQPQVAEALGFETVNCEPERSST